jgi:hypothetical protein
MQIKPAAAPRSSAGTCVPRPAESPRRTAAAHRYQDQPVYR